MPLRRLQACQINRGKDVEERPQNQMVEGAGGENPVFLHNLSTGKATVYPQRT